MSNIQTTCPYCGVGCGVIAQTFQDQVIIKGDQTHPANAGRLCAKGISLGETLGLEGRMMFPEINGESCNWDEALDKVSGDFQRIIKQHGPEAIAFYVSGQLLTEDYYVANKLMKGFIGTANIDTNSRLCMSSTVSGQKRAYGSDTMPGNYEDLEQADLLVLVGTNLAWCHPILFQRIYAAQKKRPNLKIVVIDPRQTATCEIADMHLSMKAGSDAVLFNGLLNFLRSNDYLDYDYLEYTTEGFAAALRTARDFSIPMVAQQCGLEEQQVAEFFRLFGHTEKVVTIFSQGINQSSSGTDKVNSIINCHLATGRIAREGMGPFSVTGQTNAMGGREVGALSNQLAAHTELTNDDCDLVQEFWQSPTIARKPGLKAVDLFAAIAKGEIKAVWIMATNPVVSMPNADAVKQALAKCELVVVSECVRHTDTTAYAHVLLPALTWGEKEGTVTNSERRMSRQRAFLKGPTEAKADWWIISQIAQRMGYGEHFAYKTPADIFREHATLSGFKNNGTRDFDISGLLPLTDEEYQSLSPIQWPVCRPIREDLGNCGGLRGTARLFNDRGFYTKSGKARLISIKPAPPANLPDAKYPLTLNTGRIRDQWHTMSRTGKTPWLLRHVPESYAEIHPDDAMAANINHNGLVQVSSRLGQWIGRARVSDKQKVGNVFVPIHWNDQNSNCARIDTLIMPVTDPISGQPEFKQTPVRISPYRPAWQGVIISRDPLSLDTEQLNYWVKILSDNCWRYELAGERLPDNWSNWVREQCGSDLEWLEYQDRASGRYRSANIVDGKLNLCVFIGPDENLQSRRTLVELFAKEQLTPAERIGLLTGQPADREVTVCSCLNIGEKTLIKAIREQELTTPEAISEAVRAGSNCGTCIPELKALIAKVLGGK